MESIGSKFLHAVYPVPSSQAAAPQTTAAVGDSVSLGSLQSLTGKPLGEGIRVTPQGTIATADAGVAKYGSSLGMRIADSTLATSLVPCTSVTPAGLAALQVASRFLQPSEVLSTNAGFYHDSAHPLNVAGAIGEIAGRMGRSPERVQFLQQVGLLHDFDERLDPKNLDAAPKLGTAARVQVTLAWMDKNQDALMQRMGWNGEQFKEAQALIARTDYPFDTKPRAYGTAYDGKSPVDVYKNLLKELPADRRVQVMEDGCALSYADQVGNYIGTEKQAEQTVFGLAQEIGMDGPMLLSGSAKFQKGVGADLEMDHGIAKELNVDAKLPTASYLESCLSPESRRHLQENRAFFESKATS